MITDKDRFDKKREILAEYAAQASGRSPLFAGLAEKGDFEGAFHEFCLHANIEYSENDRFVYFFDFGFMFDTSIKNITPSYEIILRHGLKDLLYSENETDNTFVKSYNTVLNDMILFAERIRRVLQEKDLQKAEWFRRLIEDPAEHFVEALQRFLFLNQLLWQTGSVLVGLGRMDRFLLPFYEADITAGLLTQEKAFEEIKAVLEILHRHYWFKSAVLMGDTGQVMILGGKDEDGVYRANELTYLLLNAVNELQLSDPKAVLRVSEDMPKSLMEEAVRCMKTGNGSPLLANDEVIIPRLLSFGVESPDAYAYGTSACWEPLITGKSSAMNNQGGLSFLSPLKRLLLEERVDRIRSMDELKDRYMWYLRLQVKESLRAIKKQRYKRNPIYSVFIEGCRESRKDIVDGGAKYHNTGMTTVGLGNAVNAMMNIEKLVYQDRTYSLMDVKKACILNYEGMEQLPELLKGKSRQFGRDDADIISFSNDILRVVTEESRDFRTDTGGRIKFGVSSPAYIMHASRNDASFDGRREGDPLMVHISNENIDSYTEIIRFAAGLDYGENRFNGNVVDFMVNPAFLDNHFDKFVELLLKGIKAGFFELQTNVLNAQKLIEAKKHPEIFRNLIVRVWGFSAYFVELPESYQDLLIERAKKGARQSA